MRLHGSKRIPNYMVGLIMVVLLAVASYVAFTKQVPWGGGTEFQIAFNSAQNLRSNTPVRIAGVEVGTVTSVESIPHDSGDEGELATDGETVPGGALVTIEVEDEGLPLKEDARFKLRPRLFLEGNLFVDVQPGSPTAATVDDGYTFPPQQTANSVQLDEILTGSFQRDSRENLQIFLDQFGAALIDEGGADSLRALNRASPDAFKFTSQVNQALLGERPGDLSNLIVNLDRVVEALGTNETALQDLVTNLRITTGSFAAQAAPLEQAIQELPLVIDASEPAFANLNAAFPPLRAFAREALPGVRSTPETLEVATPLLRQLRGLAGRAELRGLVADLRPTVPDLARLTRETIPFLEQARTLASCFNEVILPFANDRIYSTNPSYNEEHPAQGRVFEETGYGLAGISGESRSGDSNGQYIRVIGGGGTNTVQSTDDAGNLLGAGVTPFELDGAMPSLADSTKTPFRPERPCENQEPPDLGAEGGPPPPQDGPSIAPRQIAAAASSDSSESPQSAALAQSPESSGSSESSEESDYETERADVFELLYEAAAAGEDGDEKEAKRAGKAATDALIEFRERWGT